MMKVMIDEQTYRVIKGELSNMMTSLEREIQKGNEPDFHESRLERLRKAHSDFVYGSTQQNEGQDMGERNNPIFVEHYPHTGCDCYKIKLPYPYCAEEKVVLCPVSEGEERARDLADELLVNIKRALRR